MAAAYVRRAKDRKNPGKAKRHKTILNLPLASMGYVRLIGPTSWSFFVTDPDGHWAEFMDCNIKTQQ